MNGWSRRWSKQRVATRTNCPTMPKSLFSTLFAATDEQAMWRVQTQDDAEAFAQLVERWEGPIRDLCIRMLGDLHRGQDVAQEAFARVYSRRKVYQPSARFSTWLWRIALNLCYDELRRIKRRRETSLDAESDDEFAPAREMVDAEGVTPDHALQTRETGEQVRQALLKLDEIYRSVLVLRHYENLKFREIAEVLGVPEGTVKSRMVEALAQLSRNLETVVRGEPGIRASRRDELITLIL
jgi:RNA polymerase sigma-70 factor (ECF subfamily)